MSANIFDFEVHRALVKRTLGLKAKSVHIKKRIYNKIQHGSFNSEMVVFCQKNVTDIKIVILILNGVSFAYFISEITNKR